MPRTEAQGHGCVRRAGWTGAPQTSYASAAAGVAELVDAADLKSASGHGVSVRVRPPAPSANVGRFGMVTRLCGDDASAGRRRESGCSAGHQGPRHQGPGHLVIPLSGIGLGGRGDRHIWSRKRQVWSRFGDHWRLIGHQIGEGDLFATELDRSGIAHLTLRVGSGETDRWKRSLREQGRCFRKQWTALGQILDRLVVLSHVIFHLLSLHRFAARAGLRARRSSTLH